MKPLITSQKCMFQADMKSICLNIATFGYNLQQKFVKKYVICKGMSIFVSLISCWERIEKPAADFLQPLPHSSLSKYIPCYIHRGDCCSKRYISFFICLNLFLKYIVFNHLPTHQITIYRCREYLAGIII